MASNRAVLNSSMILRQLDDDYEDEAVSEGSDFDIEGLSSISDESDIDSEDSAERIEGNSEQSLRNFRTEKYCHFLCTNSLLACNNLL